MAPLRILCFGDSLTQGYFRMGAGEHPYSATVQARLAAAFPGRALDVVTSGVAGDRVCGMLWLERMRQEWNQGRFHWTIVLGGTNDIGVGHDPDTIFSRLEQTWEVPLSQGGKVLALTVPECHAKIERVNRTRDAVNKRILEYNARNYYAYDLHKVIPYHSLSPADRERYWDDGLHLTDVGYDWMGGFIADELVRIIREESTPAPAPRRVPRAGAAARKWSDGDFEEEKGSPGVLSQGYVVVRKKDLE